MFSIQPTFSAGTNNIPLMQGSELSNVIKQDLRLDESEASDRLMVKALKDPASFVEARSKFLKGILADVVSMTDSILDKMTGEPNPDNYNFGLTLPANTGYEIKRRLGSMVMKEVMNQVDILTESVKKDVKDKMVSTKIDV